MRRLLTTLVIILAVLVIGITALVMLINPNDFRHYMIAKVKQRSGYQLALDGDLRWHVWPQLSILAGRTTLSAPGAKVPVVSAENMRLDVQLWPLLSHQLSVKQVMLKGAVITLTPDSAEQRPANAPIAPAGTPEQASQPGAGWSYDIASLKLSDSLLVWQKQPNEQINLRDLNLDIEQSASRQGDITFSSRINRDQRDLMLSLSGKVDLSQYPRQMTARLDSVNYQLQGTGVPAGGIKGEGTLNADYSQTNRTLDITNLALSANDSRLTGQANAKMAGVPVYQLDLKAQHLNLDALTGYTPDGVEHGNAAKSHGNGRPIIVSAVDDRSPSFLNGFNGQLNLTADQVIYHGLTITDFKTQADNRRGHLVVNSLGGKLGSGEFNLPGTFDTTGPQPRFELHPDFKQVALGPVMQAFALPQTLTGLLSVQGQITGRSLTARDFADNWQGSGRMVLDNARLEGLNIQQLIQRAVARSSNSITAQERSENYSEVKQLTAQASLNQGNLQLADLAGESDVMALTGNGTLDLPNRQCDVNLNIRVLKGWQGDPQRVAALIDTPIPLRVHGPWDALGYELHVDQLMRRQLEDEVKRRLNDWAQKHQDHPQNKNVRKLLDKL